MAGGSWRKKAEASHKAQLQDGPLLYRLAIAADGTDRGATGSAAKGSWIPIFDGRTGGLPEGKFAIAWEVVDARCPSGPDTNEGFQTRQMFLDGEFRNPLEIKDLST
jgi:hypothetical protein